MPRLPIDYSKTVIYKIQHFDNKELLYVGHTTDFTKRQHNHKNRCKYNQMKIYQIIRENGGWERFNMDMVEEYPCENRLQACFREEEVIRDLKANMNSKPAVTISNKGKMTNTTNIDRVRAWRQRNNQLNKERNCKYSKKRYSWLMISQEFRKIGIDLFH